MIYQGEMEYMVLEFDGSISVISIIASVVFGASFFFNVGYLTQIVGSKFLDEYDNKMKLLEEKRKNLFDVKNNLLQNMLCLVPYILCIVFSYCFSPLVIEFSKQMKLKIVPVEYSVGILVFFLLYTIFLICEACFGFSEKFITRKGGRIFYHRPLFRVFLIMGLCYLSFGLDKSIAPERKMIVMNILHIESIEEYQIAHMFLLLGMINVLFVAKWISRYIVLIDDDIYVKHLKQKDVFYSFVGVAYLVWSLVLLIASIYLLVRYPVLLEMNYWLVFVVILLILLISMLAGQRQCFVDTTRKQCLFRKKIYYEDIQGKKKLLEK